MHRFARRLAFHPLRLGLGLGLGLASTLTVGTSVGHAATPPAAAAATAAPAARGGFQNDLVQQIQAVQKQVMALEDAMPADKFGWRPDAGVRSVGEVYLHIAFANYLIGKLATGKEPPADVHWEMNPQKWDKQTTDKAAIKKILEKSFAHAQETITAVPDADLEKKISFFGKEMSERTAMMGLLAHASEHLGQSIAYARSNKITPPWSKKEK